MEISYNWTTEKDWSSQLYTQLKQIRYISTMINHVFISFSAVKIYDLSYIPLYSLLSTDCYELTTWPTPSGLIVQLVEHCTGIAEVMGSNTVQAWIILGFNFTVVFITVITNQSRLHELNNCCLKLYCAFDLDFSTFVRPFSVRMA